MQVTNSLIKRSQSTNSVVNSPTFKLFDNTHNLQKHSNINFHNKQDEISDETLKFHSWETQIQRQFSPKSNKLLCDFSELLDSITISLKNFSTIDLQE